MNNLKTAILGMVHKPASANVFDSVPEPKKEPVKPEGDDDKGAEESVFDSAANYAMSDIALSAVASLHEWAETSEDDLDDGEGLGDRLLGLAIGIADSDFDGEISSDSEESEIAEIALNAMADYLISKGVPEADAIELLTDFDNEKALDVQELLVSALPSGDEADADIDNFVFGESDEVFDSADNYRIEGIQKAKVNGKDVVIFKAFEKKGSSYVHVGQFSAPKGTKHSDLWKFVEDGSVMDSAATVVLDAVYKKTWVVRAGKKKRINKRVSGRVRLNAKQKMAIKKAQRKAHTATAQLRRSKSNRVRARSGL